MQGIARGRWFCRAYVIQPAVLKEMHDFAPAYAPRTSATISRSWRSKLGSARFEFLPAYDQRRAEDHDLRAQGEGLNRLRHAESADRLHRDIDRGQHVFQVVERAEPGDHVALVEAGVHDDEVDSHVLRLAGAAGLVRAEHDIAHDLLAVAPRHFDLLDDAGVMRLAP